MLVVAEKNVGWLKLTKERQASQQIVGHRLGAVRIVRLGRRPQRGHIGEVAQVQHRVGLPPLAHLKHGGKRPGVGLVAMSARNRQTSAEFSGNARHEAAAYVKVLGGNETSQAKK